MAKTKKKAAEKKETKAAVKVEANGVVSIIVTVGRKRYPAFLMTGDGKNYTSVESTTIERDAVVAALQEALA